MTDDPAPGCPPEVEAFIDRLVEALPESETMKSDDVLCALAIFVGGVLETMEEVPAPLLLARFIHALSTSMGGLAVVVSQIPTGDEPTRH